MEPPPRDFEPEEVPLEPKLDAPRLGNAETKANVKTNKNNHIIFFMLLSHLSLLGKSMHVLHLQSDPQELILTRCIYE